ncbi:MAG: hypothetical protein ACI31S_03180 [Bacilli bacterium]
MKNKNMQIRCYVINYLNIVPCQVSIYNSNNDLIYEGNTNKYGIFEFELDSCGLYKFVIKQSKLNIYPQVICQPYYFNGKNRIARFCFFTSVRRKYHPITFKLTDKNYKNLPIEKGAVNIWHI